LRGSCGAAREAAKRRKSSHRLIESEGTPSSAVAYHLISSQNFRRLAGAGFFGDQNLREIGD
jgi:hypothetical protein